MFVINWGKQSWKVCGGITRWLFNHTQLHPKFRLLLFYWEAGDQRRSKYLENRQSCHAGLTVVWYLDSSLSCARSVIKWQACGSCEGILSNRISTQCMCVWVGYYFVCGAYLDCSSGLTVENPTHIIQDVVTVQRSFKRVCMNLICVSIRRWSLEYSNWFD